MSAENAILTQISDAVVELEEESVLELTRQALAAGVEPLVILEQGLALGMRRIGDLYEEGELILAHLVIGAEIMQVAVAVLEPELMRRQEERAYRGKVVIATVEGDIHDIGKKLVATLLKANGYQVFDLGRDVANHKLVEAVKREQPDFLCMSCLMTTCVISQERVVQLITKEGIREQVMIMSGGAAMTQEMADKIKSNGFAETASGAVALMNELLVKKNGAA